MSTRQISAMIHLALGEWSDSGRVLSRAAVFRRDAADHPRRPRPRADPLLGITLLYVYRSQSPAMQTVPITQAIDAIQSGAVRSVEITKSSSSSSWARSAASCA